MEPARPTQGSVGSGTRDASCPKTSPLNFIPKTQTIAPAILICLRRTVLNGEHLLISCKKRQPSGRRGPAPPPPPPPRRALGGVFVRRKRGRGMEGDIYVQTVWAYDLHSCWFHETFTFLSRICVVSFKKQTTAVISVSHVTSQHGAGGRSVLRASAVLPEAWRRLWESSRLWRQPKLPSQSSGSLSLATLFRPSLRFCVDGAIWCGHLGSVPEF